jgi:hypothetical protein
MPVKEQRHGVIVSEDTGSGPRHIIKVILMIKFTIASYDKSYIIPTIP